MFLFEIHQRFKGHFLNELRVSIIRYIESYTGVRSAEKYRSKIVF